jgi:hypothetical protein
MRNISVFNRLNSNGTSLSPSFPRRRGIHGVEVRGKTMDCHLRGNDELLQLGLSKCHSDLTLFIAKHYL